MGRNREPIELILAKGNRARKTKKEIRQRFETEIKAADDNIRPPRYLRKKAEKDKFYFIAGELGRIGIISNLDCDEIARYILSETDWLSYGQLLFLLMKKGCYHVKCKAEKICRILCTKR